MNASKDFSPLPIFSHLYVEREVRDHPAVLEIFGRFPRACVVEVECYKELFARPRQNWNDQKRSMSLVLARKHEGFLYPGSPHVQDVGRPNVYYNSPLLNCLYDCHYCYLQGMYPSAHVVFFVNYEDFFSHTDRELDRLGTLYLCISYDTDLLAFEGIFSLCRRWIEYASRHPALVIELRTKSANFKSIQDIPPLSNVILAWTLSPPMVASSFEDRTPSLNARLTAARHALDAGWKVRLCFDPVIHIPHWEEEYACLIDKTFAALPPQRIYDITVGSFRVSTDYFRRMKHKRPNSPLLYDHFEHSAGAIHYHSPVRTKLESFVIDTIRTHAPMVSIRSS